MLVQWEVAVKRLVFMGTPEFAVPILEVLVGQYQIVAVVTQPDRAAGRGRRVKSSPVKKTALAHDLPVLQPPSLRRPEAIAELGQLAPDVIVAAAFGQILPPEVLAVPPHGCLNVHASLLPCYRGAAPISAAILAGEEQTGVTIMLMDEGMDTGPILAQAGCKIEPQDTTGSLSVKLAQLGAVLLLETLPRWLDEGIAVYSSGEIYTRSDFDVLLKRAIKNDELLTLRTLSSPFPADPDEAVLSYAQSGAVVKFIIDTYGSEAMAELLNALGEGALYDEALVQALGVDTDGLDNAFRASLDLPPLPNTEASTTAETKPSQETGAIESEETPGGGGESQESEAPSENTEEAGSEKSSTQPAAETTEKEKSSPLGLPSCMAGMLPLLVLGYSFYILRSR